METPFDLPRVAAGPVDMRDPAFREDPHFLLRSLRESGRITRDVMGNWLLTQNIG